MRATVIGMQLIGWQAPRGRISPFHSSYLVPSIALHPMEEATTEVLLRIPYTSQVSSIQKKINDLAG